jgi:hypothetical protein
MSARSQGQHIVAHILGHVDAIANRVEYDAQDHLVKLDLSNLDLSQIDSDIGPLQHLQVLALRKIA